MRALDLAIVVLFLVGMPLLGVWIGGRQRSATDYFVSERSISWWVVCVSVVSAETSTLTVLSVPTVAYGGGMTFLSLAFGYLLGRIVVSFVLLPKYVAGELVTAYGYLGQRFGSGLQGTASVTFLVTRLLADGLRLFATAIPVKVVLSAYGVNASYWLIVAVLGAAMVVYSFLGGVRAVVWVDAIQMLWYVLGAVAVIVVLSGRLPGDWVGRAADADKFQFLDLVASPLTSPYAALTAFVGGAVLSMASHGADQLVVQRLMATKDVRASQKALIGSGVVVLLQFGLFLVIGVMLWAYYEGAHPVKDLGLNNADELFASFIVNDMPSGLSGFVIAGILAAALSSSLGALASSTVTDVYQKLVRRPLSEDEVLRQGRLWTVVWAVLLVVFAGLFSSFTTRGNPIVEQGLSIAGFTYGALLGAFLLGLVFRQARQPDAIAAFAVTVVVMAFVILGVKFRGPDLELTVDFSPASAAGQLWAPAYPWYTPLGVLVTLVVGGLLSLRHGRAGRRIG
ncbi:sodium:solute symporter [Actinosynnema pretiosum subsp. pretiosum]|uniref:Sodium:solute symporter n=1 Tax=Actinosynnema pretiosum subsp. pretiosum TaxID=103721 RepID=A0AA45L3Z7_9PSEU|nr:transporter, solute:sodium symporter (SSS) family protein [Actinosynnema pretiosum subsp. pretiosum]QUF02907.1 sodium:solute symporter [Actinosynnema pretiosum subsp. pretiosum]